MKTTTRVYTALFMAFIIGTTGWAWQDGMRSKTFPAGKGGTIDVSTSVGDIQISTWEKNEVSVLIEGLDNEDLEKVKMTQAGNVIRVSYRSRWNIGMGNVRFEITVPSQFNVEMSTSGGDLIVKEKLKGKIDGSTSGGDIKIGEVVGGPVEVTTSGGDVSIRKMDGDCILKTSGGDIRVGSVQGALTVSTSGGDIQIETVTKTLEVKTAGGDITIGSSGGEARVSTSGGNITVGDLGKESNVTTSGGDIRVAKTNGKISLHTAGGNIELKGANGHVTAKTSGGDLALLNVSGSVEGKTSGGEILAELIPDGKGRSRLSSSYGDVKLYVDEKSKVTIEATIRLDGWSSRKNRYIVKSEFPKESYETVDDGDEIHAVYKLNGGGEVIELSTSNSNIEIHKLRR